MRQGLETALLAIIPSARPLAAHLLLAGVAAELLVRSIPDSMPYMSSHTWVTFKQYVVYIEKSFPGGGRHLSFEQTITAALMPPDKPREAFLNSVKALEPILEWAVANGVLPKKETYPLVQVNNALTALNGQYDRLESTWQAFHEPLKTLRQTALEDLKRVYPGNLYLEDRVLMWLPEKSSFSEQDQFENMPAGKKYSIVDLHMAGCLGLLSTHWHSRAPDTHFYEVFPKQLLILPRNDLDYHKVLQATTAAAEITPTNRAQDDWKRFDWAAYQSGVLPASTSPTQPHPGLLICKLDAVSTQEVSFDSNTRLDTSTVPRTLDSSRSHAVVSVIIEQHMLTGASLLREQAKEAITLEEASSGGDKWADYLNTLVLPLE